MIQYAQQGDKPIHSSNNIYSASLTAITKAFIHRERLKPSGHDHIHLLLLNPHLTLLVVLRSPALRTEPPNIR